MENFDYISLKKKLEQMFLDAGITEFADIDWIICSVVKTQRSMLPFYGKFSKEELSKIMQVTEQRLNHIPLDYIFGKSYFFGREFKVNKSVLIPRQDTEVLIETILNNISKNNNHLSVLDIGTGSGIVAITLALETEAKLTAIDISEAAIVVAKENANLLNANVTFIKSDLFENLAGQKFDLIVSNPPYIESEVIESLQSEVKDHEPRLALDGGEDGMDYYRKIISEAPKFLNENGQIYFEIGYNQADAVCKLLEKYYENIKVVKDYNGNNRVVFAKLK